VAEGLPETDFSVSFPGFELRVRMLTNANANPQNPTLVFLHDSLGCITLWRDFPEQLARLTNCHALMYDRQGYGKSSHFSDQKRTNNYLDEEADLLPELLRICEVEKAILFGHSDGGSIALIAAAKFPELAQAIITEGAHVFVEDVTLAGIHEAEKLYQQTDLKDRLTKYHGNKTGSVFRAWAETWLSDDFRSWNIEKYLPRISCPMLIMQGEKDEYGTEKQVEAIIQASPGNATAHLIPDIGHTPHKEAAEEVLAVSAIFINEVLRETK
jgi:pimeloyl-ACP methyl ester carboxylesterase